MLCAALGSAAAFASDKVPSSSNLLSAGQSVSSELINLLNYFKSNYPQSPYAQLSEQQQQQLLAHASILMHKNNANKNDALSAALKELTESPKVLKQEEKVTIDPQLINLLNYFKSNYPNSPYAQLSEQQQQQLLTRASILMHKNNANKNDALSAALKELTESPNVLKQEEKVTIDPQLINLLNALKSNYPNSPYAQLSEEEQQQLLARASILTHEQNKILVLMAPCLQH